MLEECKEIRNFIRGTGKTRDPKRVLNLLNKLGMLENNTLVNVNDMILCETSLMINVESNGDTTRTISNVGIALRTIKEKERSFLFRTLSENVMINMLESINVTIEPKGKQATVKDRELKELEDGSKLVKIKYEYSPPLERGDLEKYSYTRKDIGVHRVFREDNEEETEAVETLRIIYPTVYSRITIRFPPGYPLRPSTRVKGTFSPSVSSSHPANYIELDEEVRAEKGEDGSTILTSQILTPRYPASYAITWLIPSREEYEAFIRTRMGKSQPR